MLLLWHAEVDYVAYIASAVAIAAVVDMTSMLLLRQSLSLSVSLSVCIHLRPNSPTFFSSCDSIIAILWHVGLDSKHHIRVWAGSRNPSAGGESKIAKKCVKQWYCSFFGGHEAQNY